MRSDHARFAEDAGAYLLDALEARERRAFERHIRSCDECREEVERLRAAADVLPSSVDQVEPPARLKTALMAEVEPARTRRVPRWRLRPVLVAAAVGLLIGVGVSQLGDDDTRTVAVTVDEAMPRAGGDLRISDDSGTLDLHDMPDLGRQRVYQVWLQHDDRLVPARTFEAGRSGRVQIDLRDVTEADGVYVTREPRGGSKVPSEDPIVSVPL